MTTLQSTQQPYRTWKSSSKLFSAVPRWSRPIDSNSEELTGPFGKARPLKHWRKQLIPNQVNGSSKSISIPFNYPGSYHYLGKDNCECADSTDGNRITMNLDTDINNRKYNTERNIIKSGRTEKLINPENSDTEPMRKYSHDTKSYLKSKVATYEQRLSGSLFGHIKYIDPCTNTIILPNDKNNGSQVRRSLSNCSCNIIYKKNNYKYAQEGAVSSSTRLERIKLDEICKKYKKCKNDKPCSIYLTYDDGPTEFTIGILDLLKKYEFKATFFVIGQQIEGNEFILKRIINEGHEIGNHTWSHPSLDGLTFEQFENEIMLTQDKIFEVTGYKPRLLRPPYGAMDGNTQQWAELFDLKITLWTVDTIDYSMPGVNSIVSSVLNNTKCNSNILMHDGGGNRIQTVLATEQILKYYFNKCINLDTMPIETICGFQIGANCNPNI